MKTYGGVEIWLHTFLTLALDGGEWSASCPGCFLAKSPQYPLDRRLGEAHSQSGCGGKENKSLHTPTRNPNPVIQSVA